VDCTTSTFFGCLKDLVSFHLVADPHLAAAVTYAHRHFYITLPSVFDRLIDDPQIWGYEVQDLRQTKKSHHGSTLSDHAGAAAP
jgi:hypothetical protein